MCHMLIRAALRRQRADDLPATSNPAAGMRMKTRRQVATSVRSYLSHFCQLCGDTEAHHSHQPNLRMLDAITCTLEAVYTRMGIEIDLGATSSLESAPDGPSDEAEPELTCSVPVRSPASLPYSAHTLHWNPQWTRNAEDKYCYCGTNKQSPAVQCTICRNWYHVECCAGVPKGGVGYLPFQVNYKFTCVVCASGDQERFQLTSCSWIDSILGAMATLVWSTQREWFKVKEIGDCIEENWATLCYQREQRPNWRGPLNSYFTNNKGRLVQQKPFWSIADPVPDGTGPQLNPCRLLRGKPRAPPQAATISSRATSEEVASLSPEHLESERIPQSDVGDLDSVSLGWDGVRKRQCHNQETPWTV